jgi:hypothetical protein
MSLVIDLKKKVMKVSRESKLDHFYSLFRENESVLDVGVDSEAEKSLSAVNYFLNNYRHAPNTYTGLGVKNLDGMEDLFPGKSFIQYPGGTFPFPDKKFDWVFSNAVIEHTGSDEEQLFFLNEMMRVAKNVFFTTPNKYFPVESHTNIFFMHWNDAIFNQWFNSWGKQNLYLFSYSRLLKILESSNASFFSIQKNRFLGLTMTFSVVCHDG